MLTVVSTGFQSPTKEACLASVREQEAVSFEHVYVEASLQNPPLTMMENVANTIARLPKDRIVVNLDGDDWLAHARVLAFVAQVYDEHPETWVTWGQFRTADGRKGFAAPYQNPERPRGEPWKATHLKTFRAGLFQRIRREDMQDDGGRWLELALDHAMMFPMMEMAGRDHARFVSEVLYVYNEASSWEAQNPYRVQSARDAAKRIRSRPCYARIEAL